jgi:ABC-type multidrug transport system fused ATPase/permease subunit
VLHDVTLDIAPRTRVAVVGETGSGKTTFAKLLTRLMDPTRGGCLLSGRAAAGPVASTRCARAS